MGTLNKTLLKENFNVTSADCDFTGKLKISSLINMFIQIAWHHAEKLGFGTEFLHRNNLIWVLSRFNMKVYAPIKWNDTVSLITWPKGVHRLFYLRDLLVMDKKDNILAKATSEWLLIDVNTHRPKLHNNPDLFNINKDKHAIDEDMRLIPPLTSSENNFFYKTRYSDIDINNHLTTTRYADWMFDTFDISFLNKNKCSEIILNFIKEVPFDREIVLLRSEPQEQKNYYFTILSDDKNTIYFNGMLKF